MKFFIIEGTLNTDKIDDTLMQDHINYTNTKIEDGLIFLSSLKADMSGGLFIMKGNCIDDIHKYLENEPFYKAGIQEYTVTEFTPHYINSQNSNWFH